VNHYDAIIVLSGGVLDDGTLPPNAQARVRRACELFNEGAAPFVVMTGKWGYSLERPMPVTEAAAMVTFAATLGVPTKAIVREEESTDTLGNAYFCKVRVVAPRKWHRLLVVTSDYHTPRSAYLFGKVFGPGYDIDTAAAVSDLSAADRTVRNERERNSLMLAHRWLDPIADGDDAAIWTLLSTKHPGYAKNPEVSKEELAKALIHPQ
jgi:uncharacterized SAM-binding protein YcdF (DUF218 family)